MLASPPPESVCARWFSSASAPLLVCTLPSEATRTPILTGARAGTLFRASQFLSEELPIRLAHRVQELEELPDGLNEMPSIQRVQDWYAQSFEVRTAP